MRSEEELYQLIGQNIFYYRLRENLSIEELSERIAKHQEVTIPVTELQRYELGHAIFEIGTLLTYCGCTAKFIQSRLLRTHSFSNFLLILVKNKLKDV